jgi:hypothetical protein
MSNPKTLPPLGPNERPNLTPAQIEWLLAQPVPMKKRKALHVEVSQRTFDAVKANPEKLRLIAEDADGNAVIERPGRPMTEAEAARHNQRVLAERRAEAQANRRRQDPGPEDRDQHWVERRGWDGVTRFAPGSERNEYVVSDYDIFAVLRRP